MGHKNGYRLRRLNINTESINVEEFGLMQGHDKILNLFILQEINKLQSDKIGEDVTRAPDVTATTNKELR